MYLYYCLSDQPNCLINGSHADKALQGEFSCRVIEAILRVIEAILRVIEASLQGDRSYLAGDRSYLAGWLELACRMIVPSLQDDRNFLHWVHKESLVTTIFWYYSCCWFLYYCFIDICTAIFSCVLLTVSCGELCSWLWAELWCVVVLSCGPA